MGRLGSETSTVSFEDLRPVPSSHSLLVLCTLSFKRPETAIRSHLEALCKQEVRTDSFKLKMHSSTLREPQRKPQYRSEVPDGSGNLSPASADH